MILDLLIGALALVVVVIFALTVRGPRSRQDASPGAQR